VADADRRTTRRKRPDRIPIRPLARGKQQMQFSVISALRLCNCPGPPSAALEGRLIP
jgi:hypothetical protein